MVCLRRLIFSAVAMLPLATEATTSTQGITQLADRLLNGQGDAFEFVLLGQHENWSNSNAAVNDNYTVKAGGQGKIRIEGTTLNALARGLRHYANDVLQIDEYLFVDSYKKAPSRLPAPKEPLTGASIVPYRYNFNTVTFSYTFPWYEWEDWEKQLDWAALRGVNMQLAWVGYEKIFLESFRDLGLEDEDIIPFFSGPVFQSWNRFGNVQGSWGGDGDLPLSFVEQQFELQKKIVARMVELGITPILPAFPGYVPQTITKVRPNASVTKTGNWFGPGPDAYTHDLFLDPLDPTSPELQKLFISKQTEAYGNVTNIYTLDQFNELQPASGDPEYLTSVSNATYAGLLAANPSAVWFLQGWLFYSSSSFWTQDRIDGYLGGVENPRGMMLIDLYSEVNPQWQRTNSYAGKQWIWCQLHNFGGNMNLEGRVQVLTTAPLEALAQSKSLVGFGLTPEGFEGNEIVYDILLDQAWSASSIDTKSYFQDWVTKRYAGVSRIPTQLYQAWESLRTNVYSNSRTDIPQVPVSTYQLRPALSGISNRTGHFPHPTALHYDPATVVQVWRLMLQSGLQAPTLWRTSAFALDFVDVTRQVLSNAFDPVYDDLIAAYNCQPSGSHELRTNDTCDVQGAGNKLLALLSTLDLVLDTNAHFTLSNWIQGAAKWGSAAGNVALFEFNARSQVSVWEVDATNLLDYAAKAWSGLIKGYYRGRWSIFVDALVAASKSGTKVDTTALNTKLHAFESSWQANATVPSSGGQNLASVANSLQKQLPSVFGGT